MPPLGHPRDNVRGFHLFGVVVNVEPVGLQDLEIERPILHLVAPEILRRRQRRHPHQQHERYDDNAQAVR